MKFFITTKEKTGTCYHEFYKGKWDNKTFWKDDSILLHDDVMVSHKGFEEAIKTVVPSYYSYGETEISADEWSKIGQLIIQKDKESIELYEEANEWLKNVLSEYGCFTILGV